MSQQSETPGAEPRASGLVLMLADLISNWRIAFGFPMATALAALGIALVLPDSYTATASFAVEAPEGKAVPAGLAGIATQFGITIGSGATFGPPFYATAARSRSVLSEVLLHKYALQPDGGGDTVSLLDWYELGDLPLLEAVEEGVEELNESLEVKVDDETGIVTLEVTLKQPVLAAEVLTQFIKALNEFNLGARNSRARQKRLFLEDRVGEAEKALATAEQRLKTFYERNRRWQDSPELTFEEAALRRQIDIQKEVFINLKRELESARIEEVNDLPALTTVDPPTVPQKPSGPNEVMSAIAGFVVGAMIGFGATVVKTRLRSAERGGFHQIRGAFTTMLREVRFWDRH